jgi:hypothetical protein
MKHLYRVHVNRIIEHFNQITCMVETNEAVFVAAAFQFSRKDLCPVRTTYVRFGYAMLERGRNAFDNGVHTLILTHKWFYCNPQKRGTAR